MASSLVRVRLLGDVALLAPDGAVARPGRRLRTVLSLLAAADGTVTVSTLIDEIWGEDLPAKPGSALHVLMSRLRREVPDGVPPLRIDVVGESYRLDLPRDAVDLHRFHDAATAALGPTATQETILEHGGRALALWSGEPFAGAAPTPRLEAERVHARERLFRVLERLGAALLGADRPDDVVDVVRPFLALDPTRERPTLLVAEALHRAGRTGEAREILEAKRRYLREGYGLDPSPELDDLDRRLRAPAPTRPRPTLVGRDDELAAVRALLEAPDAGAVLVVTGEAGIGKSTLLRAARREASARGTAVGGGTCDVDAPPWSGWAESLDELGIDPVAPGDLTAGRALRRRLADRAEHTPVLVTLDDVHHADSASLAALKALARLGLPAGVVLVVAAREPDTHAHPAWSATHAQLAVLEGVQDLRLRELDHDAVAELVARHLPGLAPHGVARVTEALCERTHGHALHVAAVLESLEGLDDPDGEKACRELATVFPARLRPLLDHHLARLEPAAREALDALAVLSPIPLADLAAVLGTGPLVVATSLRRSIDRGLLRATADGYAFRHALTRDAVRADVPPASAQTLHHARFRALPDHAMDTEPFTVLRHAVGAGALVTARELGDARCAAGIAAYRQGAVEEALAQLDGVSETSRPSTVALYRGLVLQALGRHEEADELLDQVVELAEQGQPAAEGGEVDDAAVDAAIDTVDPVIEDAVVAAVGHDAMGIDVSGRPRRARRLRRVRELALTDGQRVEVLRSLILEEEQLHGDADPDLLPELLSLAAQGLDDPRLLAGVRVLEANHLVDAAIPSAQRLAVTEQACALARRAGEDHLAFEAEELYIAALLAAGRQDEALAAHRALGPLAAERHHPRTIWMVALLEAGLLLARGETEQADAAALAAMTRGQELGLADAVGAYGVNLLTRHWLAGTLPELGGLPAAAATMYPHVAAWSAAAAVDAVQAGDRDTAAGHLADWHRKREGREGRLFDRPGLCLAAAAGFALGDAATAHAVCRGLPPDPRATVVVGIGSAVFGPVTLFQGLAHATLGRRGEARRHLVAAATLADELGWTPWADAARGLARLVRPAPKASARATGRPAEVPPDAPPDARPLGLRPLP
ncbi:BTAD domain-containing putative transcriptional regulator [Actinomycetospora cinnamomea]|uniref:BTAD domain-containing putative transcriptional regulator n=1 Tax=Actinomycetospora cinnamomea TaxID=663609 RepID=UPI0014026946|nr:BTAD domain-containing putative transcriptional regulator [Actinomycetospora cinnamomea]